jgi:hypothetical protein
MNLDIRFNSTIAHWRVLALIVSLTGLPLWTAGASAQFYASQEIDGEIHVVDGGGTDVPVVNGDPVGTRPDDCPADAFYFNELASDKAQLVLTDCASGQGAFSVEFQEPDGN